LNAVGFEGVGDGEKLLSWRQRRASVEADLQVDGAGSEEAALGRSVLEAARKVELGREGSVPDGNADETALPEQDSAGGRVVEGEEQVMVAIGDGGSVRFGEPSLKVHHHRDGGNLSGNREDGENVQRQQREESECETFHGGFFLSYNRL